MRLTDTGEVRRRLHRDRGWALYALADLADGFAQNCEWIAAEGQDESVVLVYRGVDPPVLLPAGTPEGIAAALGQMPPEPRLSLSVPPQALAAIRARWEIRGLHAMWRMLLTHPPAASTPAGPPVERLTPASLPEVEALYREGTDATETPDFFFPWMLRDGVFYGAWEADELAAVAGTHIVSTQESVAAIGNVYTRRSSRGRGLAQAVTLAVTRDLLAAGIMTIGLNVRQSNAAAIRAYERVGFRIYCPFYEGEASLAGPSVNSPVGV